MRAMWNGHRLAVDWLSGPGLAVGCSRGRLLRFLGQRRKSQAWPTGGRFCWPLEHPTVAPYAGAGEVEAATQRPADTARQARGLLCRLEAELRERTRPALFRLR